MAKKDKDFFIHTNPKTPGKEGKQPPKQGNPRKDKSKDFKTNQGKEGMEVCKTFASDCKMRWLGALSIKTLGFSISAELCAPKSCDSLRFPRQIFKGRRPPKNWVLFCTTILSAKSSCNFVLCDLVKAD